MKKLFIVLILCIFFITSFYISANANDNTYDYFKDELKYTEDIVPDEYKSEIKEYSLDLDAIINGDFDINNLFALIKDKIFSQLDVVTNITVSMLLILIISVISEILINNESTGYIILLFSCILIISDLTAAVKETANALQSSSIFMSALIPVYAGMIISSGYAATGTGYSTIMFIFSQIITFLSNYLLLPVCSCLLALSISSSLIKEKLKNIVLFITKSITVIITVVLGAFISILSLQTVISKTSDSIGLKTAKYFTGSFVPVVGSFVSESLSIVITSMGLLKSSIGVFSIICLIVIFLPTLIKNTILKIEISIFCYIFESFNVNTISAFLKGINNVMSIIIGIEASSIVIFIISSALTMSVS
ncbi:MAG: hypothetical protein UHN02_07945 [Acutalibacteraceae bacterium]|nr:hypothetical protein [Acutalibacteraceae bacterium]